MCDPSSKQTGNSTMIDDYGNTEFNDHSNTEIGDHDSTEVDVHNSTETSGITNIGDCGSAETIDHVRTKPHSHENNHKKISPPNTPVQKSITSTRRSPLAELLVYPTPTQNISKPKSCARVLTSAESITMLEEKARKKRGTRGERAKEKRKRAKESC